MAMLGVMFASCINDDITDCPMDRVEISFTTVDFEIQNNIATRSATRATTQPGTTEENAIENLYVFLFPTDGSQSLILYYTGLGTGAWSPIENKITINQSQSVVGKRDVYIVANYPDINDLITGITTPDDLKTKLRQTGEPWSNTLTTPILMVGNKTHDFVANYQLTGATVADKVQLTRAVAKLEINLTFNTTAYHNTPTITPDGTDYQYKYRYIDFDQNTYVLKPTPKLSVINSVSQLVTSAWQSFSVPASTTELTGYTLTGSNVTALKLTTYLNERDDVGAAVEFALSFTPASGYLPPPEFGDGDIYRLPLPSAITRNTIYRYELDM